MNDNTIAAVATPLSVGGIGIIRISGDNAIKIADRAFRAVSGKALSALSGYHATFGRVVDDGKPIDEAVALVFRAPKSYTGEDVVEISCHGGLYITQQVLRIVLKCGAKPAEPGEFTKRAFLNGKLDLTEAEAVMSIISANGEQAANAALNALDGALSREIRKNADILSSACANMSAWVDYPDEDIPEIGYEQLIKNFTDVYDSLNSLLSRYDSGMAVTQGVETAIVGKPNVGKSTLMNLLAGCERSIVTSVAGTTRDVIEETVRLGKLVLRLADTAGIRASCDEVENIGVHLAEKKLERASLVLSVFDYSRELNDEDIAILEKCREKLTIAVVNKTDLQKKLDTEYIKSKVDGIVFMSARNADDTDELAELVEKLLGTDKIDTSAALLSTERQRKSCAEAVELVAQAIDAMKIGMTPDAVNVCAECAVGALLELTGEKATDSVVNSIFSQFCVGK